MNILKLFRKSQEKATSGRFADFLLHAPLEEQKEVFKQAAYKANEEQRKVLKQAEQKC